VSDLITAQVKQIVGDALVAFAEDLTVASGSRLEDDGAGGWKEATQTEYAGKGFNEVFTAMERLAGIPDDYRKIIILANTITVEPKPQDKITFRGETLDIISVDKDPAQATYTVVAK